MGSYSSLGDDYPYERNKSSVYQYRGDFSWMHGVAHFQIRRGSAGFTRPPSAIRSNWRLPRPARSPEGRTPTPIASASGSGIADLLLGAAQVQSGYVPQTICHHFYYGAYAQDVLEVATAKLTVTFGVRWSYESGEVENNNQ